MGLESLAVFEVHGGMSVVLLAGARAA